MLDTESFIWMLKVGGGCTLEEEEEEEKEEEEKGEKEEEGLMEGALARYIVTRWSTPCIELVCEFLFLKKTNFILYS